MSSEEPFFEETFVIQEVDPDGKKFDKVSRFKCWGDLYELDLLLDLNVAIFDLTDAKRLQVALARTLHRDFSSTEPQYGRAMQEGKDLLSADFDYVMYGKVFKFKESSNVGSKVEVYISFGGLLMQLTGEPSKCPPLVHLRLDENVFLLVRRHKAA